MTCLPKSISGEVYPRFNPRTPVEILAQNLKSIHGLAMLCSAGSHCRGAASPAAQRSLQSMLQFPIPNFLGLAWLLASGQSWHITICQIQLNLRPGPSSSQIPYPTTPTLKTLTIPLRWTWNQFSRSMASWTQSLLFGMKIMAWRWSELGLHQWAQHCISYSVIFIDSIVG